MEEKKELMTLPFGKNVSVGNYVVVKKSRSLSKREVKILRDQQGIPAEVQKNLQRGSLPVIVVQSVSGSWSVSFVCGMSVYALLDNELPKAVSQEEDPQEDYNGTRITDFAHLFNMWYMDTCVVGDPSYQEDKAKAFKAMMERQKAVELSKEEDDKILDEVKAEEDAKATILDMSAKLNEQEKKGGES